MNKTTINGKVYESHNSMSIINDEVICDGDYYINGKLQNNNNQDSMGAIITKVFSIEQIKSINNGYLNIEIMIDPSVEKEEVSITAYESIHKNFLITFKKSILNLEIKGNIFGEIKVFLKAKNLESILNSGLGDLKGYINTKKINLCNEGIGNIKFSGKVDILSLKNSGIGDLDTLDLFSEEVSFLNSGIGNMKFTSRFVKKAEMSGIGSVKYYADEQPKILKSGLGSIYYLGFKKFETNLTKIIVKNITPTSNDDNIERNMKVDNTMTIKKDKSGLLTLLSTKFKSFL